MSIVNSSKWWAKEIIQGEQQYNKHNYEQAIIHFYRAFIHARTYLELEKYTEAKANLNEMLSRACKKLGVTFSALNEPALQQYYDDLATINNKEQKEEVLRTTP